MSRTFASEVDIEWPDYAPDEVLPGLHQGGTEDDDRVWIGAPQRIRGGFPFDLVVTLYADATPVPWGVQEIRFGFYDAALDESQVGRIIDIARAAHSAWRSGDSVLVRCQAGVNRSGLVTALVLMLEGYSALDAIATIRARRGRQVLCNEHFEEWLLTRAADHLVHISDSNAA